MDFYSCTVVSAAPLRRTYLIQGPRVSTRLAVDGQSQSYITGVRDMGVISPGTEVIVAFPGGMDAPGVIVSTVDSHCINQALATAIPTAPQHSVGEGVDSLYDSLPGKNSYANNRPNDMLAGDWGKINELGVQIGIGLLRAWISASWLAGIEFYAADNLTRIVGWNTELISACEQTYRLNDEGEAAHYTLQSPYYWEATGVVNLETAEESLVEREDGWELQQGGMGAVSRGQRMYARRRVYEGYLGDLHSRFVCAPAEGFDDTVGEDSYPSVGLSSIHEGADGSLHLTSARSVTLQKRCLISVPDPVRRPDDPAGDNRAGGYQPAGSILAGAAPFAKYDYVFQAVDGPGRAADAANFAAYAGNYQNLLSTLMHTLDFTVPEESEVAGWAGVNNAIPSNPLPAGFISDLPASVQVPVDHRQVTELFESTSGIFQMPDGSIVIHDGYGAQLTLSGGNIYVSAPGDVIMHPGRSVISLAPGDLIMRAGNDVDISSTAGSCRLKAEDDVYMLAANSGSGAMILESRAANSGLSGTDGITLKSLAGFNVDAGRMDFRSDGDFSHSVAGTAYIDAGGIYEDTPSRITRLSTASFIRSEPGQTLHAGSLNVAGSLGAFTYAGASGYIGSEAGVAEISNSVAQRYRQSTDASKEALNDLIDSVEEAQTERAEAIQQAGFAFRADTEYPADFRLYSTYWQQLYALRGGLGHSWQETPVTDPATDQATYPYPGLLWNESSEDNVGYGHVVPALLNEAGIAVDRDQDVYEADGSEIAWGPFKDRYKVSTSVG